MRLHGIVSGEQVAVMSLWGGSSSAEGGRERRRLRRSLTVSRWLTASLAWLGASNRDMVHTVVVGAGQKTSKQNNELMRTEAREAETVSRRSYHGGRTLL